MKILLVNNETTKEDLGWIERSVELGLPERTNQIENLAMRLREYGDVEIIHHSDLDPAAVDADCVFLSGDFAPWDADNLEGDYGAELQLIREAKQPIFGICAGIQLIAAAYGAKIVYMAGRRGEHGFTTMDVVKEHPLTKPFDGKLTLFAHHGEEADRVPEEFELLASTELCKVQIIAHKTLPIVGTQLHPELRTDEYPDGKTLIDAFFATYVK